MQSTRILCEKLVQEAAQSSLMALPLPPRRSSSQVHAGAANAAHQHWTKHDEPVARLRFLVLLLWNARPGHRGKLGFSIAAPLHRSPDMPRCALDIFDGSWYQRARRLWPAFAASGIDRDPGPPVWEHSACRCARACSSTTRACIAAAWPQIGLHPRNDLSQMRATARAVISSSTLFSHTDVCTGAPVRPSEGARERILHSGRPPRCP